MGLRMALGATARDVSQLIVGQALRLCATGAVLGVIGALTLGRFATSLLYRCEAVRPADLRRCRARNRVDWTGRMLAAGAACVARRRDDRAAGGMTPAGGAGAKNCSRLAGTHSSRSAPTHRISMAVDHARCDSHPMPDPVHLML